MINTIHTAVHGSCVATTIPCAECETEFEPRILEGTNKDRFCNPNCKDRWWNRERKTKNPPLGATKAGDISNNTNNLHSKQIRKDCKLYRVLAHMARGKSLTHIDAERDCHDHYLNTTISKIRARGIFVSSKRTDVKNFSAEWVWCKVYWLEPSEQKKAAILLGWVPWQKTNA